MKAVEECGPHGEHRGEPLIYPEMDKIVAALVATRKYVCLCTNALLLKEKLSLFTPSGT